MGRRRLRDEGTGSPSRKCNNVERSRAKPDSIKPGIVLGQGRAGYTAQWEFLRTDRPILCPNSLSTAQRFKSADDQLRGGSRILQICRQFDTKPGLKRENDMRHRQLINVENGCAGIQAANLPCIGLIQHDIQYHAFQMLSDHNITPQVMNGFNATSRDTPRIKRNNS